MEYMENTPIDINGSYLDEFSSKTKQKSDRLPRHDRKDKKTFSRYCPFKHEK
jgi:hypothetical protein